jgi:hypothetical protein
MHACGNEKMGVKTERCMSAVVNGRSKSSDDVVQEEMPMRRTSRCDGLDSAKEEDRQRECSSSGEVQCNQESGPKRKAQRGFPHGILQCLVTRSSKDAACAGGRLVATRLLLSGRAPH